VVICEYVRAQLCFGIVFPPASGRVGRAAVRADCAIFASIVTEALEYTQTHTLLHASDSSFRGRAARFNHLKLPDPVNATASALLTVLLGHLVCSNNLMFNCLLPFSSPIV